MRNAVATWDAPRSVEIKNQHLPFVVGKKSSLSISLLPSHIDERIALQWRHGIRGARWSRDNWSVAGVVGTVATDQQQTYGEDEAAMERVPIANCRLPIKWIPLVLFQLTIGNWQLAIITSQIHYQPKYFRFVPGEAVRRGRDIHPRPNGQDQLS